MFFRWPIGAAFRYDALFAVTVAAEHARSIPLKVSIVEHLSTQGGGVWWEQRKTWFTLFGQQSIESTLGDLTLDSHRDGIDALVQKQTVASG